MYKKYRKTAELQFCGTFIMKIKRLHHGAQLQPLLCDKEGGGDYLHAGSPEDSCSRCFVIMREGRSYSTISSLTSLKHVTI
jgi:hypothetical protein